MLMVNQKFLITNLFRDPSRSTLSGDNIVVKREFEGMTAKECEANPIKDEESWASII